jgi:hypothetical protein
MLSCFGFSTSNVVGLGSHDREERKQERTRQTLKEKKKEKKFPSSRTVNFNLSSSGVSPLASNPVCLCLVGRFGADIW